MKYSIVYSFLFLFSIVACRKSDNAKLPDLVRVPVPMITKDATGDGTISKDNPDAFNGKFVVDLFFKSDAQPQKMDVVIRKNGAAVKVFKESITTFPTTVAITGAELASLFGAPLVLGDKFDVGVDITTKDGVKAEAFPATGVAYSPGVANQPGSSTSVQYAVVCPFEIADFVGNATIDDPDFWGGSYPVTITLEGTDTYKISGWVEDPAYYILAKVNKATQTVAIAKRAYGATLPGTSYTNPTAEGTGTIDACEGQIVMSLDNAVDQGSFGASTVVLKK